MMRNSNSRNVVQCNLRHEGERIRDKLMKHMIASTHCRHVIRMSVLVFTRLCDILVRECDLRPTIKVTV